MLNSITVYFYCYNHLIWTGNMACYQGPYLSEKDTNPGKKCCLHCLGMLSLPCTFFGIFEYLIFIL